MPRKKKRKTTARPGIEAAYIASEYASFDENNPVCNGHVLYQYVKNENRSIAETVAVIKESHKSLDIEKYDVSKTVHRMNKFK